jgi:dolichol-phosphate mannosyltransferase
MKDDVLPGWTTMSLQSSGLFLLLFVMLTLMGEYLGRLLEESSSRPLYHVRGELTSSVMITNNTQRNVLGEALCDCDDIGPAYTSKTNVVQVSIENG